MPGPDRHVPETAGRGDGRAWYVPAVVVRTVEELYAEGPLDSEATDRLLGTSLEPRGPDLLFAMAEELGLGAGRTVLDVGCRDGAQLVELHRRTGCAGVGLEPVAANLARASADALAPTPIRLVRGVAEAMPFAAGSFDLVWVRDVLVHVANGASTTRSTATGAPAANSSRPPASSATPPTSGPRSATPTTPPSSPTASGASTR